MILNIGGHQVEIDEEDFWILRDGTWFLSESYPGRFYLRKTGKKKIYFHRRIMGATEGQEIDHIDNNSLNNQKSNLRFCTRTQNNFNSRSRKSRSGLRGIVWCSDKQKWRARIKCQYKVFHLGYFYDPQEAHEAYKRAANNIAGEFAR